MDKTTKKKIETLREELKTLDTEITTKRDEIKKLIVASGFDFEGSYVEYYNGSDYTFMFAEKQKLSDDGLWVTLTGPAIRVDANPLEDPVEEIGWSEYFDETQIYFGSATLEEVATETVRKIGKSDFARVLNRLNGVMRENLFR